MAIKEDTAALVAAQLTLAWAQAASKQGLAGVSDGELPGHVAAIYEGFRDKVSVKRPF